MSYHTSDPVCPGCQLKLKEAHMFLRDWFNHQVKPKYPLAHISWSYRDQVQQEACFNSIPQTSKLHYPDSAHNKTDYLGQPEARALDLFEIKDGSILYDHDFFKAVSDDIDYLGLPILWGGVWKSLGDSDHWQMKD